MAFTLEKNAGVFVFSGMLDEKADISELALATSPIKINLKKLEGSNSIGMGKLLSIVLKRFDAKIEYHECPPHFVEAINHIPRILGAKSDPRNVKSVILPFMCPACHWESEQTLKMEHVRKEGSTFQMDGQPCPQCGVLLRLGIEPDAYFFFLSFKTS